MNVTSFINLGYDMLTQKQSELLAFTSHMDKHEVPPSFEEMRDALGLASKSGIHRLVSGLEERGYIRRLANRARAIEIYDQPMQEMRLRVMSAAVEHDIAALGRIAAGTLIEALSDPTNHSKYPPA